MKKERKEGRERRGKENKRPIYICAPLLLHRSDPGGCQTPQHRTCKPVVREQVPDRGVAGHRARLPDLVPEAPSAFHDGCLPARSSSSRLPYFVPQFHDLRCPCVHSWKRCSLLCLPLLHHQRASLSTQPHLSLWKGVIIARPPSSWKYLAATDLGVCLSWGLTPSLVVGAGNPNTLFPSFLLQLSSLHR